jgi:DNA-binding winged helix-turn-helix (wHTH) protein
VHLTPKAFDLLVLLIGEAPRVVPKSELHQRLWPGTFVSDATLVGLVKEIRRELGDRDPGAPIIRTAHRVGYAFCPGLEQAPSERPFGIEPTRDHAASVSRAHARIVIGQDGVSLEDCGSKNGTRIGEERVTNATALRDGDRLRFGTVSALYRASGAGMSTETHGGSGVQQRTVGVHPHEDPSHG